MRVGDDFPIRSNRELSEFLNDIDVVQCVNIQRLRWLSHIVEMKEDASVRRVFSAGLCGVGADDGLVSIGRTNRGSPVIDWCG